MIGIAGGTGFIGTHLREALIHAGFSLQILCRSPSVGASLAGPSSTCIIGDIGNVVSLRQLCVGCDTVIHLVGLIREQGNQNWNRIHVDGTRRLVTAAKESGVRQFIYVSAAGANKDSDVPYLKTKGLAEEIVKESGIPYTIFRPSFVVGPGDKSINFFAKMIRMLPIVPVIESGAKFQPVSILDLVHCIQKSIAHPLAQNKTFEIGGPEELTMMDIYRVIGKVLQVRRVYVALSPNTIRPMAAFGRYIPNAPLTLDQLNMLTQGSTCNTESVRKALGIEFMPLADALRIGQE